MHISQNLAKVLIENWFFFFLNCPGGNIIWISWEKFRKIALLNRVNSNNTISQIWNTWRVKIAHFVTNIDVVKIIAIFY